MFDEPSGKRGCGCRGKSHFINVRHGRSYPAIIKAFLTLLFNVIIFKDVDIFKVTLTHVLFGYVGIAQYNQD